MSLKLLNWDIDFVFCFLDNKEFEKAASRSAVQNQQNQQSRNRRKNNSRKQFEVEDLDYNQNIDDDLDNENIEEEEFDHNNNNLDYTEGQSENVISAWPTHMNRWTFRFKVLNYNCIRY